MKQKELELEKLEEITGSYKELLENYKTEDNLISKENQRMEDETVKYKYIFQQLGLF